jgi:hypothetical protein
LRGAPLAFFPDVVAAEEEATEEEAEGAASGMARETDII